MVGRRKKEELNATGEDQKGAAPVNYQDADAQLQGRCKDRRKVANNTYLERRGDAIAVKLHATDVVTFHPDGSAELSTGGWFTVTTKARMNDALSCGQVYSDRGEWFYIPNARQGTYPDWKAERSTRVRYFDGLRVDTTTGEALNPLPKGQEEREAAERADMRKRIAAFAKLCEQGLRAGTVPDPGPGDCWFCVMRTQEGETLGDASGGHEHLLHHLEENYVVPSLIVNALRERGYESPGWIAAHAPDLARRAVRRYLGDRLIGVGLTR